MWPFKKKEKPQTQEDINQRKFFKWADTIKENKDLNISDSFKIYVCDRMIMYSDDLDVDNLGISNLTNIKLLHEYNRTTYNINLPPAKKTINLVAQKLDLMFGLYEPSHQTYNYEFAIYLKDINLIKGENKMIVLVDADDKIYTNYLNTFEIKEAGKSITSTIKTKYITIKTTNGL